MSSGIQYASLGRCKSKPQWDLTSTQMTITKWRNTIWQLLSRTERNWNLFTVVRRKMVQSVWCFLTKLKYKHNIQQSHTLTAKPVLFCPRQHHGFVYKFSPLAVTPSQVGWVIVGREEREFVIETSVFVFSSLPWQYAFYWSPPFLEFHFGVF